MKYKKIIVILSLYILIGFLFGILINHFNTGVCSELSGKFININESAELAELNSRRDLNKTEKEIELIKIKEKYGKGPNDVWTETSVSGCNNFVDPLFLGGVINVFNVCNHKSINTFKGDTLINQKYEYSNCNLKVGSLEMFLGFSIFD